MDEVHDELVVQLARPDVFARGDDGRHQILGQCAHGRIGDGRGLLDGGERLDEEGLLGDGGSADGEVLHGACGVRAVVGGGGYEHVSDQVVLLALCFAAAAGTVSAGGRGGHCVSMI